MNGVALTVFIFFFLLVTVIGFVAARWRHADLGHLNEWGLGGRSFGTIITWFLLGGDLYTAYTFIAVPALVFGVGALGFFALPYTIIVYPFVFLVMPRLWSVAHKHQYVTPSDFVRGRYGSRGLSLAVAATGILATMPYIALQLVGIQVVLQGMGIGGSGASTLERDLPLFIAFAILAAYTYQSGLRAPALIAFVKDTMIYITVLVAIVYIPAKLGGWGHIFDAAGQALPHHSPPGSLILGNKQFVAYSTLALGSALALFLYPHSITAVLSSGNRNVVRRNAAILPAYSFLLGLLALLGFMVIAAGLKPSTSNLAIPQLFDKMFPDWFLGFGFAAIAIGALVPAAIMSIAAANLFTRNVYREWLRPDATPRGGGERGQARLAGRQVRRARLRPVPQDRIRHQPAAAGRGVDPADAAGGGAGAVHPLVPPRRAAAGLGRRDPRGDLDGLVGRLQGGRPVHPVRPGHHRVPGAGRVGGQPAGRGRRHPAAGRRRSRQRQRRDR
jgi:solute:Na+ symporter, SSS family